MASVEDVTSVTPLLHEKDEAIQRIGDENRGSELYTTDGSVDAFGNRSIKSKSGGWRACPYILGNEFCERLAYYGINTNMVIYLTKIMHFGNAEAAKTVTNWSGTCYITTFVGALLADSYLGRYWTIASLSSVYLIGMMLLTLSASIPSLRPSTCPITNTTCEPATTWQTGVLYCSLYLIALGTGGIKPCVSSFGADQFDTEDDIERKQMTSFFNWFYFAINVGALIASSCLVYVQENVGWGVGFGIPSIAMAIAICMFFVATPLYRNQKPGGSPLTRIAQVLVASFRKCRVKVPKEETLLYEAPGKESAIKGSRKIEHTQEFMFLDKAATEVASDRDLGGNQPVDPWGLCTVTQVEEVKIIVRLLPIWASGIIYFTVYCQMATFFVEQGERMDCSIGPSFKIPPASLSMFDTLSIIIWIPIYDWFLVPFVRKYTGVQQGFTQIQRMSIGLVLSVFAMVVAALVEIKRLKIAAEYGMIDNVSDAVPMTIFWQVPQYFLIGASEVFTSIGQLEFFYDQSPDAMRSFGSALALSTVALGNYLSSLLVTIITSLTTSGGKPGWIPDNLNRGHLDYFFLCIAIMAALNWLFFFVCARHYKYKSVSAI